MPLWCALARERRYAALTTSVQVRKLMEMRRASCEYIAFLTPELTCVKERTRNFALLSRALRQWVKITLVPPYLDECSKAVFRALS
jgi:hypothetical protein